MHRFFLPPDQIRGDTAHILGGDFSHLTRVLRARVGETVILLDNAGNAFQAVVVTLGKAEAVARIICQVEAPAEPAVFLTVAQALAKGDKLEQVIQHGTEIGAGAFVPVRAERCVAAIAAGRAAERGARWSQIAKGAAEQCGRARIPEIAEPLSFTALLSQTAGDAPGLLLHLADDAVPLRTWLAGLPAPPARLLLAVGPEGGWSPAEVSAARAANWSLVSLGRRVLRTETAALVALSQILYALE
ncbi:MAG TPA: 16S rRNA (uracil(1498)-N(3))-methyltransferase [Chthonomonadaceae bacterium]|nr:16S rRNA (uracil(1498)-N(3))-methyltransferase [Chthonomonadaceae bacterium]